MRLRHVSSVVASVATLVAVLAATAIGVGADPNADTVTVR